MHCRYQAGLACDPIPSSIACGSIPLGSPPIPFPQTSPHVHRAPSLPFPG